MTSLKAVKGAAKGAAKGDVPYTLFTVLAILLVLGATVYFVLSSGGFFGLGSKANASATASATPSPFALEGVGATPSPSPAASASVSASPSPSFSQFSPLPSSSPEPSLEPWPSTAAAACSGDEVCLDEKPFYCSHGRKISYCTKCGCPSGLICGKGAPGYSCDCIHESLAVANCSMLGPGGNVTVISPSPTPSVAPSPVPCNASHYASRYGANATPPSDDAFLANLSAAYSLVFGKNISWTWSAPFWVWSDASNAAQTEIYVSKGREDRWLPGDALASVTANQLHCTKTTALTASSGSTAPFQVDFKQNCWNWTFLIDAKTTDFAEAGAFNLSRGYLLATRFADVCPP